MKKLLAIALVLAVLVGGTVGCEKPKETKPAGTGAGAGATPTKAS